MTTQRRFRSSSAAVPAQHMDDTVVAGSRGDAQRAAVAFAVGLAGLLLTAAWFGSSAWSWVLWILVGAGMGAVARRTRLAIVAPVAVVGFHLAGRPLGVVSDTGPFWALGALVGTILVLAGYAIGSVVTWRERPVDAGTRQWRALASGVRRAVTGIVLVALVALAGYTTYVGVAAADALSTPSKAFPHAWTPATRYGWAYEAVNYDRADDDRLAASNPTLEDVRTPPSAGDAVVSSDGISLAGWYIPAGNGAGPTAPTLVLVPGWTSSKSEMLMYGPAFHDEFNLLLVDLRNQGRSERATVTFGVRERLDVRAMIDWLVATKDPGWIGGLGNSMGGISLLAEATTDPRVRAVILDSTEGSIVDALGRGLEHENGHPAVPGAWAGVLAYSLRIGADVTAVDPVRTIGRMGDRPVLLLYGTADVLTPPHAAAEPLFHAALNAGVPVELHYVAGGTHGELVGHAPGDYARWARSFLSGAVERAGD